MMLSCLCGCLEDAAEGPLSLGAGASCRAGDLPGDDSDHLKEGLSLLPGLSGAQLPNV